MKSIVFFDSEISLDGKILDLGAVRDGLQFHSGSIGDFAKFISGAEYICGHNVLAHDLKYLGRHIGGDWELVDTLFVSPLLFPKRPYHALVKDDKLQTEELNNPLNDSKKAMRLFYEEINTFSELNPELKDIYCTLLYPFEAFKGFFSYVGWEPKDDVTETIRSWFDGKICANAEIEMLVKSHPVELAYALAIVGVGDKDSIIPPWVLKRFLKVDHVLRLLRSKPCGGGCGYCGENLDVSRELKRIFGYDSFRTYNGEPLQESAARAAVEGKSLLAIFPTGGGKSVTFQLPALMAGETVHGLTVVISPLQSLMKDQVDNLEEKGIVDAVTVNGLMSQIERANALKRMENGSASLLYISPEQLRSKTIERLLLSRQISRVVIDEAHCFSAWGQDFRVDYLYIGDFIRDLQAVKGGDIKIPVSCFTATAKQKVISDIRDYFIQKLGIELEIYATTASRENLRYEVLYKETEEDKYLALRHLIETRDCPTIVYVSRTGRTHDLADRLTRDGFLAGPFNGKMDPSDKIANQEAFIRNELQVIVATSAFGMGVDKKDVKLVVHYDISDSLENYVQEAGRAGRDERLEAECYVLYNDGDLDKHFILLNQTKLSMCEIQQVWRAIKSLTRSRPTVRSSPLEIARKAGWSESVNDVETRVKTAIAALESAGYVRRGRNSPQVYATGILAKNVVQANEILENSRMFSDRQLDNSKRIISSLISSRGISKAGNDDAETRVDYLADMLGLEKREVIDSIQLMRNAGLLADTQDMSAFIHRTDSYNKSNDILRRFSGLEEFLLTQISTDEGSFNLKELNESAAELGYDSSVKNIRTILNYWRIKSYTQRGKSNLDVKTDIIPLVSLHDMRKKYEVRIDICNFIVEELYSRTGEKVSRDGSELAVEFSLIDLHRSYQNMSQMSLVDRKVTAADIEDALLYLSKVGAMSLEGGFLVLYNALEIERLVANNRQKYKQQDYRQLDEFYQQKMQQIHIVGEYANLLVRDYDAALAFVNDYFQMDYKDFISKHFEGERAAEITRNITPEKYKQLFDDLSDIQKEIINDRSQNIVVVAGPGSGKTRVLVHKLASLLMLEDVKHEQLLMLTFSRSAVTEFKERLLGLVGNAARFVDIKTFHSYCFELLGRVGSLEGVDDVVKQAVDLIRKDGVEPSLIAKTVVVVDEAQDMVEEEYALIEELMKNNADLRVIAVGDDDQSIFEFRGSDSKYLGKLIDKKGTKLYEMSQNYRSRDKIVSLANAFAKTIGNRMKTEPGVAVSEGDSLVRIVKHTGGNLEVPVVNHLKSNGVQGRVGILTHTNEEAARVLGLLKKEGIPANLIQSNESLKLYNLAEIRYFLRMIDKNITTPVISDANWETAKEQLKFTYETSECLEICLRLISVFENTYETKYRSDVDEFIRESEYADFYSHDVSEVTVSTYHKSKGCEFDSVYILMDRVYLNSDEDRRKVYVALTRARNELFIHYNNGAFDRIDTAHAERYTDKREYKEPPEILLQLTHKDVYLDFFKGKKDHVFKLQSGDELYFHGEYLCADIDGRRMQLLKYSKACCQRIGGFIERGYRLHKAYVRFVVAWMGEDDDTESAIILPEIYLSKDEV